MDPATILVAVLTAGVVALLVWFGVNSRRNEARKKELNRVGQAEHEREAMAQAETEDREAA